MDRLSLLADPALRADPAYLGHMLNDGATCASEARRPAYVAAANAARNVEQVMLEGCHMAVGMPQRVRTLDYYGSRPQAGVLLTRVGLALDSGDARRAER